MNLAQALALAVGLAGLGVSTSAMATTDLALSSAGASFVKGSSFTPSKTYKQSVAEANLITNTPSKAYFNGDMRYIFSGTDQTQDVVIKLAADDAISTFAATFGATDRTPRSLTVSVSSDGSIFTQVGLTQTIAINHGHEFVVTPSQSVFAQYIMYTFGAPRTFGKGSGISQVFADSVPEPATWVMLLLGFGMIGLAVRRPKVNVTYA